MDEVYLIVGVDQEGDATWDIVRDRSTALKVKRQMDKTAFDSCVKIWQVDLTANMGDSFMAVKVLG